MICSNCGKELSDTAKFCGVCGASVTPMEPQATEKVPVAAPTGENTYSEEVTATQVLTESPAASEQYNAPSQQYNYYQGAAPAYSEPKVGKGKYIKTKASGGIKFASFASRIVGLLCIAVCVAMFAQLLFGSIFDMPIIEYAGVDLEFDEDTIRAELDKLQAEKDRWQAEKDRLSGELERVPDGEEKEELEESLDQAQETFEIAQKALDFCHDFFDSCSIASVRKLGGVLEDAPESIEYDPEDINEIVTMVDNILLVFGIYCAFIAFLTLLAFLFRNNILTVLAFILGIGFPILFSGMIYAVLFAVSYLLLFILQFAVNHSYRKYKKAVA